MAAALALNARPGDVVVSIGTSGTAFAVAENPPPTPPAPSPDSPTPPDASSPSSAPQRSLASHRRSRCARRHLEEFNQLALTAPPAPAALVLLPYLDGERTRPAQRHRPPDGLTRANLTPANLARLRRRHALRPADAVDALVHQGVRQPCPPHRRRRPPAAVRAIAPQILGRPVTIPAEGEYVADGAARQAAWALSGKPTPPEWEDAGTVVSEADPTPQVRERYAEARNRLEP